MSAVFRIHVSPAARRQLDKLDREARLRVGAAIDLLAEHPRPPAAIKLKGGGDLWRVRTGTYRIVYEIHDRELLILVVVVGHRREVYH